MQAASRQTAQLRGFIAATRPGQPSRVLVSHQSNIRVLTGRNIGSGAILVIRANGGIKVVGTIPAP